MLTSAEGDKGLFPEYDLFPNNPAWTIWHIAKEPWSFTILALSAREGISSSLKALGCPLIPIPSTLTADAPNIYNPIPVARFLRYKRSSSVILPESSAPYILKGGTAILPGLRYYCSIYISRKAFDYQPF